MHKRVCSVVYVSTFSIQTIANNKNIIFTDVKTQVPFRRSFLADRNIRLNLDVMSHQSNIYLSIPVFQDLRYTVIT